MLMLIRGAAALMRGAARQPLSRSYARDIAARVLPSHTAEARAATIAHTGHYTPAIMMLHTYAEIIDSATRCHDLPPFLILLCYDVDMPCHMLILR